MTEENLFARTWSVARAYAKKLLRQERVSQFKADDPNSKYACFFTAIYMYFRTTDKKFKMSYEQYKAACLKVGAIRETFYLLDRTKMAAAAGHPELVCKHTSEGIREKILELLLRGVPVPFSLSGKHFESIDGYDADDTGRLTFHVDDPGGQGDTKCDGRTLVLSPSKRKITTVYWFEER